MIKTKNMLIAVITLVIIGLPIVYFMWLAHSSRPLYFTYLPAEKKQLSELNSSQIMTAASLAKWDNIMMDLVKRHKLGDVYASRLYAYVYTAQRDAAFLSMNIKHKFMGSLEPVTADILCLFFADSCKEIKEKIIVTPDKYSRTLSTLVMKNIKLRMQEDKNQHFLYSEKKPQSLYWAGVYPYYGQDSGSWKTWIIKSGHELVAAAPPAPDDPQWQQQLDLVKKGLKNITPAQATSVVFWAGNPSTITPPGIWLVFANDYMFSHQIDLEKALFIRSILAMGIADSMITVFNSKYTYWCKRPFMRDASIYTVMPTPNHPSYPAGHSTLSATAATLLSFYFPENKKEWEKNAFIASNTRVWGGIHFPIDIEQGLILGQQVGQAIIQKLGPLYKNDH